MRTIKLLISDDAYDKFMKLLNKFSKEQVKIVAEKESFQNTKAYLNEELREMNEGKASWHTLEEAEKKLDDEIQKHEDRS
jgi:phage terminase large subunit